MKRSFLNRSNEGTPSQTNTLVFAIFFVSLLFFLIMIVMRYYRKHHKPEKPKYSFLNLKINPADPELKIYQGAINFDSIAATYIKNGMPDLLQHKIWDSLDSTTVPIIQYAFGKYYNPVTTSQTARAFYQRFLQQGEARDKIRFLNNIAWLLKNHQDYYFRYAFEYRHVSISQIKKGWISAMAQGEALGVLSVAFHTTGDKKYLDSARGVFRTLHINTDSLWCFGIDNKGYYWLEEYPTEDFCHVLNGMLYALWGIWDYYVVTRDKLALILFKAGIRTIADNYSSWKAKTRTQSYYCWHRHVNAEYHRLHLHQLQVFADFFGIPEFREAGAYFSRVDTSATAAPLPKIFFLN